MNLNFQYLIPTEFDDNSRVWVYQSNRQFDVKESLKIEDILKNFCKDWNSHGNSVRGYANLFFGHFIIVMADESLTKVGGCSTDSSVRLIKSIEQDFNVQLTDRLLLAFIIQERIQLLSLEEINLSLEDTLITGNTLYFNNTILTKKDLLTNWIIPLKKSWLAKRLPSIV